MVVTPTAPKILGPRERDMVFPRERKKCRLSPEDAILSAEVDWERVSGGKGDPSCTLGVGEWASRPETGCSEAGLELVRPATALCMNLPSRAQAILL